MTNLDQKKPGEKSGKSKKKKNKKAEQKSPKPEQVLLATEELIDAWFNAPDLDVQKKLAADIQTENYANNVPYVPTGQFIVPTAYRKTLSGIIIAPVVFLWSVEKK